MRNSNKDSGMATENKEGGLKIGDVVYLPSGGPKMTVIKIWPKADTDDNVRVAWHEDGKINITTLPEEAFKHVGY